MQLHRTDLPADPQDMVLVRDLLASARKGDAYRVRGDAAAMRAGTERLLAMPFIGRGDASVDVAPGALGGIDGEWMTPAEVTCDGVLVFLHGGGYVRGNLALGRSNATELAARSGARVFAAAYRQAPEAPFPAAVDDTLAVCAALAGQRYALVGESAGGGLVFAAAMVLRDRGAPAPVAISGISPFLDLTMSGESWDFNAERDVATRGMGEDMIRLYIGDADRRDFRASPMFGDFRGLPPVQIVLGNAEGLYSEALTVAESAAQAGVPVALDVFDGMPHGFSKYTLKAAETAMARVAAWVGPHLQGGTP